MEISYWTSRWKKNNIGWHIEEVYPHLKIWWNRLELEQGAVVLVPMCGKSRDLWWLAEQGMQVIGVEVSEIAARQFFEEQDLEYTNREAAAFTIFESGNIQYWNGDIFKLEPSMVPPIDAIFDKSAIVALPPEKRTAYAELLLSHCHTSTRMFVSTFEYNQEEMSGPPFAVFRQELENYYSQRFNIELLHEESMLFRIPKFRRWGLESFLKEKIYMLTHR